MKKFISLSLAVATAVTATSCGEEKVSNDVTNLPESRVEVDPAVNMWKNDVTSEGKEPIEWYINMDWYNGEWGRDLVTQKVTTDTGIEVIFSVGTTENLNTMIASGDIPDMITVDAWTDAFNKEAYKISYPLNQLAEKYNPYFMSDLVDPYITKWHSDDNGDLYYYPNYVLTPSDVEKGYAKTNNAFLVREDIYKAIGSPDMTTEEGFLKALADAKEMFPTDDYGNPMVPLGVSMYSESGASISDAQWLAQRFLNIPRQVDGKAIDQNVDPEFQRWIGTLNKAYNQKLLSEGLFTGEIDIQEKVATGSVFAILTGASSALDINYLANKSRNPEQNYIPVEFYKNSKGEDPLFRDGSLTGWTYTYITTSCKDPQTALNFMSYMTDYDGRMANVFGVEGVTYTMVDGKPTYTEEYLDIKTNDTERAQKEYGVNNLYWFGQDAFELEMGVLESHPLDTIFEFFNKYNGVPDYETDGMDSGLEENLSRDNQKIQIETAFQLISAIRAPEGTDLKQYFDAIEKSKADNNYPAIEEAMNANIQKNIERLK